jgi:hypothetical protein
MIYDQLLAESKADSRVATSHEHSFRRHVSTKIA